MFEMDNRADFRACRLEVDETSLGRELKSTPPLHVFKRMLIKISERSPKMKLICSSCSTIAKSSISEKFVGHIFGCTANQTTLDFNNGGDLPPCL